MTRVLVRLFPDHDNPASYEVVVVVDDDEDEEDKEEEEDISHGRNKRL